MGFNRPSKIQEMALPMMLAHPPQNLIAQSQSGTGKTAAFVLAMLSRVNALKLFPQCLCLAPTYELALQTGRVVERMGKFCVDVQVMYAIRGNQIPRGTDVTKQIVIGTPGTVLDWCFKRKLIDLTKIRVFVLDEADVMIDTQGFADQKHSKKTQGRKKILEKIMTENFPYLAKDKNLEIQESQRSPNGKNTKNP
uniref:Helicase ATP-binding domain-containing protein n=1 Tax=Capra hircus TaxID=9925 RepID=A0A452DRW7_CAPHI